MMDLSRKVAPFDPQMVRDAISHYEFIAQHLLETADEMDSQAEEFRERATDAKLKAEHLTELLEEFPDGRGTALIDGLDDAGKLGIMSENKPCRICLGTGHLSPGCGARDERDYGKTCYWCEGTGIDHEPTLIDESKVVGQAPANAPSAVREPEPCPTHSDGGDDARA